MKLDDHKPDECAKTDLLKVFNDLKKAPMTIELLESTKIGLSVNNFRKSVDDTELASIGKDIIRKWKALVPVKTEPQAPAISAGVMIANLPWNIAKTYSGIPPSMIVWSIPARKSLDGSQPMTPPTVGPNARA